jgi:hypothetical protein
MAGVKIHKLKGSTLPEALAAMAITVVCMGIATSIYFNVLTADNGYNKLKAHLLLDKLAQETKQKNLFINEDLVLSGVHVHKTIEAYTGGEQLFSFKLSATDDAGKNLGDRIELIRKDGTQ